MRISILWGLCGLECMALCLYVAGFLHVDFPYYREIAVGALVFAVFSFGVATGHLLDELRTHEQGSERDEWSELLTERTVFDVRRLR